MKISLQQLAMRQAMPLDLKELYAERRIRDWYDYWCGQVYVAFSGGKDSTVLLNIVRRIYPEVPAVFIDTGLEYPEIRSFVKATENVVWIKPSMTFKKVIEKHGYPVVSKCQARAIKTYRSTEESVRKQRRINRWTRISKKWEFLIEAPFKISDVCCYFMKKAPAERYEKQSGRKPMMGMMAYESGNRTLLYLERGCNAFNNNRPVSWPIAFFTDKDVWEYIRKYDLPYSSIYDMGADRTGCMFCMFGVHLDCRQHLLNRFQRMQTTHPKYYRFCMNKLKIREIMKLLKLPYSIEQTQLETFII